jgi:hypothetical protein
MPITKKQAEEIFGNVIKAFPTRIIMAAYDNHDALRNDIGIAAPPEGDDPPAFYSAGVLYVMLDAMADYDMGTMVIAHEVGHQVFDPGSIFAGIVSFRLWMHHFSRQRGEPERNFWHMQNSQNIYSDIVLNRVIWKDKKANDVLGANHLNNGFKNFYRCEAVARDLMSDITGTFRRDFLGANMALGYLEIFDPPGFNRVMAGMREPHLQNAIEIINRLVRERDLARRNLQEYYDIAVDLYGHLFELDRAGYNNVAPRGP